MSKPFPSALEGHGGGSLVLVQGFVAAERNGVWRRAIEVPGLGALNAEGTDHRMVVGLS